MSCHHEDRLTPSSPRLKPYFQICIDPPSIIGVAPFGGV